MIDDDNNSNDNYDGEKHELRNVCKLGIHPKHLPLKLSFCRPSSKYLTVNFISIPISDVPFECNSGRSSVY